jgi:hypothetical protein
MDPYAIARSVSRAVGIIVLGIGFPAIGIKGQTTHDSLKPSGEEMRIAALAGLAETPGFCFDFDIRNGTGTRLRDVLPVNVRLLGWILGSPLLHDRELDEILIAVEGESSSQKPFRIIMDLVRTRGPASEASPWHLMPVSDHSGFSSIECVPGTDWETAYNYVPWYWKEFDGTSDRHSTLGSARLVGVDVSAWRELFGRESPCASRPSDD